MLIEEIVNQVLSEIAMNPNALRKQIANINARAGMEFELYVPGIGSPDEGGEIDYDEHDERARNFYDISQFFLGGDDINSRRDVDSMIEQLEQRYREDFVYDKMSEYFYDDIQSHMREYFRYNVDMSDIVSNYMTAVQTVFDDNEIEFDADWESDELESQIEEHNLESEIISLAIDESIDEQDSNFEQCREQWEEDNYQDIYDSGQSDWLSNEGLDWMSNVQQQYGWDNDVYWPYSGGGEIDWDGLAEEFSEVVGKQVNYGAYHSAPRLDDGYSIEPDSSLNGMRDSDDAGLEFISPPMPVSEMLDDIDRIVAWANEKGIYTDDTTGLHMNVSVDNYSRENLDFVKLVLLMGDKYVLQQFGRQFNSYARSMFNDVVDAIKNQDYNLAAIFDQMKNKMEKDASKTIHGGRTAKYSSVNVKDTHVEFRGPGGDWLSGDLELVKNTLMRFVVALDAACDPEKHKQEYLKKLYQLAAQVAGDQNKDITAAFAKYATGTINRDQLKQLVQQRRKATAKDETGNDLKSRLQNVYNQFQNYRTGTGVELDDKLVDETMRVVSELTDNVNIRTRVADIINRIQADDSQVSNGAMGQLLPFLKKYLTVL